MKIHTSLAAITVISLLTLSGTSYAVDCWKGVCYVERGDTLAKIARTNHVSADTLMKINGITNPRKLYIGKQINLTYLNPDHLPSVKMEEADYDPKGAGYSSNIAIVTPGDTLFSIAKETGTSVDYLKQLNGLTSNTIYVGQRLLIH